MMTRVLLTFLIGLVVSLGALVSDVEPVLAKNWNQSKSQKAIQNIQRNIHTWSNQSVCDDVDFYVSGGQGLPQNHYSWVSHDHLPSAYKAVLFKEAKRRGLSCGVSGSALTVAASESRRSQFATSSDVAICVTATKKTSGGMEWDTRAKYQNHVKEAKRRGLSCGVIEAASSTATVSSRGSQTPSDKILQTCHLLQTNPYKKREFEKKNRVICNERLRRYNAAQKFRETSFVTRDIERGRSNSKNRGYINDVISLNAESIISRGFYDEKYICKNATFNGQWYPLDSNGNGVSSKAAWNVWYLVARYRGLTCGVGDATQIASSDAAQPNTSASVEMAKWRDTQICNTAVIKTKTIPTKRYWNTGNKFHKFVEEAARRGLSCRVTDEPNPHAWKFPKTAQVVITQNSSSPSAALTAAEKEAERLRQELAALRAEKSKQQQTFSSDARLPKITIASVNTKGKQGIVRGRVKDNTGIAEVTVGGIVVPVTSSGDFEYSTFVPSGGLTLKVQATDLAGLTSMMSVTLERNAVTATAAINFDRLNPMGKRVKVNKDAIALIVGVSDYENTPAKAVFADADAMMFHDYASEKLGIPESRIKTLVNDAADERELLLSVKSWLTRASKQGKSDVYVFFAGHGLASDDGQKMYLLPHDGAPELLEKTAILRQELFDDIASANPRSVTVFLDTCYSGTTRGTDMLIASRPIAIKALQQSVPDNFTVMTAARGDQTAKPLEEAKHGMFSYFLMKGMEGEADKNRDNKITAGELHRYVQANVVQQSSGSQTPELQGDASRVLVQFQ